MESATTESHYYVRPADERRSGRWRIGYARFQIFMVIVVLQFIGIRTTTINCLMMNTIYGLIVSIEFTWMQHPLQHWNGHENHHDLHFNFLRIFKFLLHTCSTESIKTFSSTSINLTHSIHIRSSQQISWHIIHCISAKRRRDARKTSVISWHRWSIAIHSIAALMANAFIQQS